MAIHYSCVPDDGCGDIRNTLSLINFSREQRILYIQLD
jgi:hypothetical protein